MNPIKNKTDISALFGEEITIRKVNGQLVIRNRPRRKVVSHSEKQLVVIGKFQEAAMWAVGQMKIPEIKAWYAARRTDKLRSAYIVALTYYLNGRAVDPIVIMEKQSAIEEGVMAKVAEKVEAPRINVIGNESGNTLEQGLIATYPNRNLNWNYSATFANPSQHGTSISATSYILRLTEMPMTRLS